VETVSSTSARLPVWVWISLATAIILGIAGGWLLKPVAAIMPPTIRKLDVSIDRLIAQDPSISSDGRYWAFETADTVGFTGITIVDVQDGTYFSAQESDGYASPRFSPDSRWLLAGNGTDIVSILVPDGRPIPLSVTGSDYTWVDNNTIAIVQDGKELTLLQQDTQTTRSIPITDLDTTITNIDFPAFIPGTEQVLLTLDFAGEVSSVAVFDLRTETLTTLARNACCGRSVRDKVIVYHIGNRVGQVVAQQYDAEAKALSGSPVDIIGSQVLNTTWTTGHDDSFLYLVGAAFDETEVFSILNPETLQSRDMQMEAANYDRVSFSPDGQLIAAERQIGTGGQSKYIVVFNTVSGVEQRLTYQFDESRAPTWSPNGKIYYSAGPAQSSDIYAKNADGTGPEELVVENGDYPHASRDGKWLAFASGAVLKALNLETGEVTVVDSTFARQGDPKISPDGRYIAFTADNQTSSFTSGGQRLFVRSFPDPNRFYEKVTETYADDPEWAADGSVLYFRNRGQISRMEVDISGIFTKRGSPRLIHTYPGVNVRLAVNPTSGELISVHPLSDNEAGSNARYILIESFTAYLDKLMDR
jgi:Tol biopolymer transport system component